MMRHIIRYYLLDSGPIYLGGIARLETRTGRPRQNVYYYQFTAYEHSTFYCRHYVILWTRFSVSIDVIFS